MGEILTGSERLDITRRDQQFAIRDIPLRGWHGGCPHTSHFFNALSVFFPDGEKMFIDSVRHYLPRISDPQLLLDVHGFIGQEAMHGREHRVYNESLKAQGYPVDRMEQVVRNNIAFGQKIFSPRGRLAVTMALEHLTAILADQLLREPRILAEANPRMAALWRWHAVEETEHKAVAFDVYRQVTQANLRSYFLRCGVLFTVTFHFFFDAFRFHRWLLLRDGEQWNWRGWCRFFNYAFGRVGILRRIVPAWLGYFRPGFHPWRHDNRLLIQSWRESQANEQA